MEEFKKQEEIKKNSTIDEKDNKRSSSYLKNHKQKGSII